MKIHEMPGGGPAFPSHYDSSHRVNITQFPGILIRDYLIAHAPEHPQPWFKAAMPPCPQPMDPNHIESQIVRDDVKNALDACTDPHTREGAAWLLAQAERAYEIERWQEDRTRETYLQWPAAWADEQLKRRAAWLLQQGEKRGD